MKSMGNSINGSNDSNNINNWLGFSLSPHLRMEIASSDPQHHHHHHHQQYDQQHPSSADSATAVTVSNTSLPTSFYLSTSHFNTPSGICYGIGENNTSAAAFHSPLSVMPLKSDGSLCIMEALTRSQPEVIVQSSTTPKLEDFLGGATMETHHHYSDHERETISLDSMYSYHQNADTQHNNRQHSLDHFSIQTHHPFYSGMPCHGMYNPQLEHETTTKETQLSNCNDNSSISQMGELKTWVPRHYSSNNAVLDQQMNSSNGVDVGGGASGSVGTVGFGDLQSLSLSMSPGSQSSCVTAPGQISPTGAAAAECVVMETKKRGPAKVGQKQPVHRKSIDTFGQRTSQFRGVTRHRWTGRYEAHLWDNSCKKEGQTRKGRQVYLGGYDMEEKAARAYDLAALKYWGPSTHINFGLDDYQEQLEEMKNMSRQEYVAHLRRKSSGFSRGASIYRGVTRHHQHGRWQARIGRVAGNKDLYLGTFSTQEEAAEAYDIAAIKFRGVSAVTNFDITRYDVERIMASNTLLAGDLARRNKETESITEVIEYNPSAALNSSESLQIKSGSSNGSNVVPDWKMALYHQSAQEQPNNNSTTSVVDDSLDQKPMNAGTYHSSTFSMAMQDLIGVGSMNSSQRDESAKLGGAHFSNPSSLVTSLSSSREGSPDRNGATTMLFAKPPLASKFISPTTGVTTWFQSAAAPMRPNSISMPHLPLFAAWNDS